MKTSEVADAIFTLFDKYGGLDYIGENVTQLEHAIQCAMMAEKESNSVEVRGVIFEKKNVVEVFNCPHS